MSATEAVPEPTHSRFKRKTNTRDLYPYRVDADKPTEWAGDSPQAQFLAAPEGYGARTSDKRNHAYISGLGAGKTAAGVLRAAVNAEKWNPGELGMIVAPTVPSLKNAILPVMREFGLFDAWEYKGKGSDEPGIHTPSGSRIILESADNQRKIQRLRGPSVAWIWLDEAAQISEEAWDVLQGRLRSGEYRNAFVTTTPRGYNWVYDRFHPGETDSANAVLGVPSWANPHNPEDYFERLEEEYEGSFYEQEVEGAFVQFEGLIYPWFGDEHLIEELPDGYDEVVYGADWGHNNPAVILAIVRQGDRYTVVDEWYERRCTVNDHARAAETFVDRWGEGPIYCDPSEPANIQQFRRENLDARKAENDVIPGIQHIASKRDELRVTKNCQNLRNEFNQYQYRDGGDGEKPLKQNDHALDALRYALFSDARRSGKSKSTDDGIDIL